MAYIPQGTYHFHLSTSASVGVGIWGVTSNSVLLEHVSADGRVLAQRAIATTGVARVTSSSLQFTSIVGGTGTGVTVSVCLRELFVSGDYPCLFLLYYPLLVTPLDLVLLHDPLMTPLSHLLFI